MLRDIIAKWLRAHRIEALATVIAIAFCLLKIQSERPLRLFSDEVAYTNGALDIVKNGLFREWAYSSIRTYLYPLILAILHWVLPFLKEQDLQDQKKFWAAVMAFQFFGYFGVGWFLRRRLPFEAVPFFVVFILNIWNLIYVTSIMTETLSTLAILICLWAQTSEKPRPIALGLALGASIMARPGNIFLIAPFLVFAGYRFWKNREFLPFVISSCLAFTVMLPQLINNINIHHRFTPLTAADLGGAQITWGITMMKYATAIQYGEGRPIIYPDPFVTNEERHSGQLGFGWYFKNPFRGFASAAVSAFNVLDQDKPVPYNEREHPWYRWPLSALNHLTIALGFIGLVLVAKNRNQNQKVWVGSALYLIFGICAYSLTAVEARFGLPFITILLFYLPAGWDYVRKKSSVRARYALFAYLVVALALSAFVETTITYNPNY